MQRVCVYTYTFIHLHRVRRRTHARREDRSFCLYFFFSSGLSRHSPCFSSLRSDRRRATFGFLADPANLCITPAAVRRANKFCLATSSLLISVTMRFSPGYGAGENNFFAVNHAPKIYTISSSSSSSLFPLRPRASPRERISPN